MSGGKLPARGLLERVRKTQPVIHCITNYVTAGDVANMLLAAGASPVMADGVREAAEAAGFSQGMVINLGTLKEQVIPAMVEAGRRAAALGHPVVLDPVGAGSFSCRLETALRILDEVPCALIRGNASEIRALEEAVRKRMADGDGFAGKRAGENCVENAVSGEEGGKKADVSMRGGASLARGVDVSREDILTAENIGQKAEMAKRLSRALGTVVLMSGETDLATDGRRVYLIRNGHPLMGRITGSGCMLDGVLAACLAVGKQKTGDRMETAGQGKFAPGAGADTVRDEISPLDLTVYAAAAFAVCGELAGERTEKDSRGPGRFRMELFDAMYGLTDEFVMAMADVEGGDGFEI